MQGMFAQRKYFYPRSPRGERLGLPATLEQTAEISIHAPREGSDRCRDKTPMR